MTKRIYTQQDIDNRSRYMHFYDTKTKTFMKRLVPDHTDLIAKLESEGWAKHPTQAKQKAVEEAFDRSRPEPPNGGSKEEEDPVDTAKGLEPEKRGRGRPKKNDQ